jgi:hypothetical protein
MPHHDNRSTQGNGNVKFSIDRTSFLKNSCKLKEKSDNPLGCARLVTSASTLAPWNVEQTALSWPSLSFALSKNLKTWTGCHFARVSELCSFVFWRQWNSIQTLTCFQFSSLLLRILRQTQRIPSIFLQIHVIVLTYWLKPMQLRDYW